MNSVHETNSLTSSDTPLSSRESQRPIRLQDKFLLKSKRKTKKPANKTAKVNKRKFKSRMEGGGSIETKRKFKSPHMFSNARLSMPILSSTPVMKNQPERGNIQNIKTVMRVQKQKPLASFRISNKGYKFGKPHSSLDHHGNKIGFGTDPNYRQLPYDKRNDFNLVSRGTILRMFSDTESELNLAMPNNESGRKMNRNLSQPNLPKTNQLVEAKLNKKATVYALPNIAPNILSRITTPGYVGEEAYTNFYKKFRRLSREKEISPNGYSATTAYLTSCEKMKVAPNPIGILKWEGNENEINVSNYFMGKKYAFALSNSMKYLKTEKLNLQSNNLGSNGSIAILENLSQALTDLDLSKNNMGDAAMQKLVAWFESMPNKWELKFLNLSTNKFSDASLFSLSEAMIIANPPLRLLDLSHNKLETAGCTSLGDFIRHEASELRILCLQWNKIHSDGAIYLFDAISHNTSIKNLDLSWNMLGTKDTKKSAEVMQKLANIVNAGSLKHLDISYNSLKCKEWSTFGDLIRENHSLYGLHMHGNAWMVDTYGVVRTDKKYNPQNYGKDNFIGYHSTDGRSVQINEKNLKIAKVRSHAHWWVWEGWREEKFVVTAGKSHNKLFDPVYIHFDFDDYKPDLMVKVDPVSKHAPVTYTLERMIPPGKSMYFYTVNHEHFYAKDAQKVIHNNPVIIKNIEFDEVIEDDGRPPESDEEEEESIFSYSIPVMNYTSGKTRQVLDEDYKPISKKWKPRPKDKIYIRPRNRRPRTPWSFPISIFRDYVMDNEELLSKWFEFDWSCIKLPKMTDEEMDGIKEELKKGYKVFKTTYKYLSGIGNGSGGGVFSIPLNWFTDFVKQIDLVNGKDIRFAESDTLFLTMNKRSKNHYLNPGVALIRYQFLEILTRLALKRYEDTNIASSKAEAVKLMYERNLYPFFAKDDPQKFRDTIYWVEEVDNLFKSHLPLFEYLFKNYGGTHMKPGDSWFMTTDELETIFADANLITDTLVSRDLAVFYNLSMMTQVNEIEKDRHLRMTLVEFLEAIARWANILSYDPYEKERLKKTFEEEAFQKELKKKVSGNINSISATRKANPGDADQDGFEDAIQFMPRDQREAQPLHVKIENIIPRIFVNCTNNAFKEKWEWPAIDPFTGLYVEKSKSKTLKAGTSFSQTMKGKNMPGLLKA